MMRQSKHDNRRRYEPTTHYVRPTVTYAVVADDGEIQGVGHSRREALAESSKRAYYHTKPRGVILDSPDAIAAARRYLAQTDHDCRMWRERVATA